MPEGIEFFDFSLNGDYLMIKTIKHIFRYSLVKKIKECGSVLCSEQSKYCINNKGDVAIVTLLDYTDKESRLLLWKSSEEGISENEFEFGYIEPDQFMYDAQERKIICNGIIKNDYPEQKK